MGSPDYSAGQGLSDALAACTAALRTLQQLGRSDDTDAALTTAEAVSYDSILSDGSRSQAWKIQAAARQYINVITELGNDLTGAANVAGRQYKTDAASVFGTAGLAGDPATLTISRRDAGERVANITDSVERQRLLANASLNGDDVLARVIAESAVQFQDFNTLNAFVEAYPDLAAAAQRLWDCATKKMSGADITATWRVAALKPAVLQSLQDFEIVSAALGNVAAGSWNAG
jgi:hypothetical protein